MLSEFDLIARYFKRPLRKGSNVTLGVGDDCALLAPAPGMQLAVSTDMLVEGRHFFPGADPFQLGHKCLAVNLSDLAAMGAKPVAFALALALPEADESWLAPFADGLFALADKFGCELIGGDTTKGPRNICITVFGDVPAEATLKRSAAQMGDDIWISGTLGEARLALAGLTGEIALDPASLHTASQRLHMPQPRIALGLALRRLAHAAIDISDGLIGDLGHILEQSRLGAVVNIDALPIGPTLACQSRELQLRFAMSGGDDYELCFTASPENRDAIPKAAANCDTVVSRIGTITAGKALLYLDSSGNEVDLPYSSFDHFSSP